MTTTYQGSAEVETNSIIPPQPNRGRDTNPAEAAMTLQLPKLNPGRQGLPVDWKPFDPAIIAKRIRIIDSETVELVGIPVHLANGEAPKWGLPLRLHVDGPVFSAQIDVWRDAVFTDTWPKDKPEAKSPFWPSGILQLDTVLHRIAEHHAPRFVQQLLFMLSDGPKTIHQVAIALGYPEDRVRDIVVRVNEKSQLVDADSDMRTFYITQAGQDFLRQAGIRTQVRRRR